MTVQLKVKGYINGQEWGAQQSAALPNVHFTFSGEGAKDGVGHDLALCGFNQGDLLCCFNEDVRGCVEERNLTILEPTKLTYSSEGTNFDGNIPVSFIQEDIGQGAEFFIIFVDEDDPDNGGLFSMKGTCTEAISYHDSGNILLDLNSFCIYNSGDYNNLYDFINDWHEDTGHSNLSICIYYYDD